ncbi:Uncharacterized protein DBV15_02623 [Temnothorax longispinosus]|uniref:Uncharacterized protein n=1 Tax=Temnothorax longispinosus TaxID=300112 RepID=A0A4V3S9N9_9HYME|nr:Uncharacterized protein DBV15_02623 [Temnothorax longispinosus]
MDLNSYQIHIPTNIEEFRRKSKVPLKVNDNSVCENFYRVPRQSISQFDNEFVGYIVAAGRSPTGSRVFLERRVKGEDRACQLGHREGACAYSEAHAFGPKIPAVAAAAVNVPVRTVVQVRRIQGTVAFAAVEAPLVPNAVLRDHLLGGVHRVAAARATVPVVSFLAQVGLGVDAAKNEKRRLRI